MDIKKNKLHTWDFKKSFCRRKLFAIISQSLTLIITFHCLKQVKGPACYSFISYFIVKNTFWLQWPTHFLTIAWIPLQSFQVCLSPSSSYFKYPSTLDLYRVLFPAFLQSSPTLCISQQKLLHCEASLPVLMTAARFLRPPQQRCALLPCAGPNAIYYGTICPTLK